MSIVGQKKLLSNIDFLMENKNFPKTSLFVGGKGSGRHLICNYVSSKLGYGVLDITDMISKETIDELFLQSEMRIIFVDFNSVTIKNQNALLKFLEEPPTNIYIIGICVSLSSVIDTVKNRCQIFRLEEYTKEELSRFSEDELAVKIFKTPGSVQKFSSFNNGRLNTDFYVDYALKLVERVGNANVFNVLTIGDKLSFKDEADKLPIELFIDIVKYHFLNKIILVEDGKYIKGYELTSALQANLFIPNIDKKKLFEHYLLELKYTLR